MAAKGGDGLSLEPRRSWRDSLATYLHWPVLAMFALGFSAGLPILLVFSTLSAWMREGNISLSAIGFTSYVLLTYSFKFAWAPLVDRLPLPGLTRWLGRRRSWMLVAQIGVAAGLFGMASTDPHANLTQMILFGIMVAFCSATQDISIDAYRIEAADKDSQAAMAATYIYGYRLGMLLAGGGALFIADSAGWFWAYTVMAIAMGVGMLTVLAVREPKQKIDRATIAEEERVIRFVARNPAMNPRLRGLISWLIGAVVAPFADFFRRNGLWMALIILAFVGLYRISDIIMGVMAIPLYVDLGYTLTEIGAVTKAFGLAITLVGVGFGGVLVARYGIMRPLFLGAILVAASNLMFAYLAWVTVRFDVGAAVDATLLSQAGPAAFLDLAQRVAAHPRPSLTLLTFAIGADNFSAGMATTCFIAYLSSLTNQAYTATQYALFSSFMTLPGKLIAGLSGVMVEAAGYVVFFLGASAAGIPAILLTLYLIRRWNVDRQKEQEAAEAAEAAEATGATDAARGATTKPAE